MVSVDKFYVYGGGRWREVDTGSGKIDGWGRAKFLVARNGKLEATRSRPVLAALRALAEKTPSAAREGPQLSYKYPRHKSQERNHPGCEHQCCHHTNSGSCTTKSSDKKTSIAIQCNNGDLSTTNAQKNTTAQKTNTTAQNSTQEKPISTTVEKTDSIRKRKRSTSSEDLFHTKVVTVATVHSPRKEQKRRRIHITRKPRDNSTSSDDSLSTIKLATSPHLQHRRPRPLKRKRSSSGSVILKSKSGRQPRKVRKKSLNDLSRSARKNFRIVISSDDSDFDDSKRNRLKIRSRQKSSSTDEPLIKVSPKDPKRTIERYSSDEPVRKKLGPKKIKENPSGELKTKPIRTLESLKDETIKRKLEPKTTDESSTDEPIKRRPSPKRTLDSSKNESNKRRLALKETTEGSSTDELRVRPRLGPKRTESSKDKAQHRLGPKRTTERSSTDETIIQKQTQESSKDIKMKHKLTRRTIESSTNDSQKAMSGPKHTQKFSVQTRENKLGPDRSQREFRSQVDKSRNEENVDYSQDASKELLIDERDVEILRLFLLKHCPDEDLVRFDTDDDYKKMHFYQINPLVNVERCPRIARMIRDSQDDKPSLVDFASKLGLRSVSEASSVKRYKTRKREEKNYADTEEIEKENDRPSKVTHKVDVRREIEGRSERDDTIDTVELSSDSGKEEVEKKVMKKPRAKAVSKRPPLNEYSNLEDHAIVSWVSVGGRACSVNGNRIWRELQEQFRQITGHERTWHSLRNRYLRYILPRLGALALPPSLQTRLRAAAATGELKAKRRSNKRNSIFKPAERGASSRRPPHPPHPAPMEGGGGGPRGESGQEDEEHADSPPRTQRAPTPRAPTPRYSDVTRQFAQKHRYSSERSSSHGPHKSRRLSPDKSSKKSRKSRNISEGISSNEKCVEKSAKSKDMSVKSRYESSEKSRDTSDSRNNSLSPKINNNKQSEKSRNSVSESRNNRDKSGNKSPIAKSRNSMIDKSMKSTPNDKPNKNDKRKQSTSPRRKKYRSPSDSSYDDRSRRESGDTRSDSDSNHSDLSRRKSRLRSSSGATKHKSINSPSYRRKSNRINSPESRRNSTNSQEANRRKSNRIKTPKSDRQNKRDSSNDSSPEKIASKTETNRRKSNRVAQTKPNKNAPEESNRRNSETNSPSETRRKRGNSPDSRNSKRKLNHKISPEESNRRNSETNSPSETRRKRGNSPDSRNSKRKLNHKISPEESNRRNSETNSPSETRRKENRDHSLSKTSIKGNSPDSRKSKRRSNRYKSEIANLAISNELSKPDRREMPKRTRKLFNPKDIL